MSKKRSGVYVIRTRKHTSKWNLPVVGRQFGYVGETTSFERRIDQHINGDPTRGTPAKPWADLDPRVAFTIPLPAWKPLLRTVETLVMFMVWPVYNIQKNRWNPRRIPKWEQHRQRAARNARSAPRWGFWVNPGWAVAVGLMITAWAVHRF